MDVIPTLCVVVLLIALLSVAVISAWKWWEIKVDERKNGCRHEWKTEDVRIFGNGNFGSPNALPTAIDYKLTCKKCGDMKYIKDPRKDQ